LRRLAALRYHYLQANLPSPTDDRVVARVLAGIRRTHSVRPQKKRPLTVPMLRDMVEAMAPTLRGRRDKALLVLCFAGAFRRSEVAALELRQVEWVAEGLKIHLDKSKGNQEGEQEVVAVLRGTDLCPVQALKEWIAAADLIEGPLFRKITKSGRLGTLAVNDRFVADLVKWYLFRAGYDHEQFSAHSLRSGFLTAAAANRASLLSLQRVSRHRRVETLMGYVDQAEAFVGHAAEGLL
jgi:integrase